MFKNSFFAFCFYLLLWGCQNAVPKEEKASLAPTIEFNDHFRIDPLTFLIENTARSEFEQYKYTIDSLESNYLSKDAAWVKRTGDTLSFKLENGKQALLVNNHTEEGDQYVDYEYKGKLSDIGHYIVDASYYEWREYFIINAQTGDTTEICGYPEISPDRKHLIAGNEDLLAGFAFNGIEIFEIRDKQLKKLGEKSWDTWGPEDLYWADNQTVLFKINVLDTSQLEMTRTEYIKLRFK